MDKTPYDLYVEWRFAKPVHDMPHWSGVEAFCLSTGTLAPVFDARRNGRLHPMAMGPVVVRL